MLIVNVPVVLPGTNPNPVYEDTEVAFVDDQDNVIDPPELIVVGVDAINTIVGDCNATVGGFLAGGIHELLRNPDMSLFK